MDTRSGVRGRRRHRLWPEALKREIVAASLASGASVSQVARQYDVNANQVFSWRKQYRAEASAAQFVPVTVTADHPVERAGPRSDDRIEIELTCGSRIRVGSAVKAVTLRMVLDVLARR